MSKQVNIPSLNSSKSSKLRKGDQIGASPLLNQQNDQDSKRDHKRFYTEGEAISRNGSNVSGSQLQENYDDNDDSEVKVKGGFQNYYDVYYHHKNTDTIFKDYYKPEVLAKELKKNKLKITDLSITKYNSSIIQREESNDLLFLDESSNKDQLIKQSRSYKINLGSIYTLPRIKYNEIQKEDNQPKHNQHNHGGPSGFVSFEKIKDMNSLLLQSIEQDYCEKDESQSLQYSVLHDSIDLFSDKRSNLKKSWMGTKSFLEKSMSQIGDKSYIKNNQYSNKEKLIYALQHNKFHENQLKELDYKEQIKSVSRLQLLLEKQQSIMQKQKYRKYPSAQPNISLKLRILDTIQNEKIEDVTKNPDDSVLKSKRDLYLDSSKKNNSSRDLLQPQKKTSILQSQNSGFLSDKRQSIVRKQIKFQGIKENKKVEQKKNLYPCFVNQEEFVTWKPDVRELFKVACNGENVYMFGGCSSKPMSDMCVFNIQQNKWSQVNSLEDGRYNHMMGMYKKNVIIFGGEKQEGQSDQKSRNCMNDTRIYNPEKNIWKFMRPTGDIIESRRNASACVLGRYFVVQGGINQKGTYLNDVQFLDIINHRWNSGQCEDRFNYMLEGRAYHKSCSIFHPERKIIELFKEHKENLSDKQLAEIKHEGIYYFGGQNQNGEANNQLTILIIQTRPMHFIQPETLGKKPDPRYNHSLNFNAKLKLLIVHGGMNENLEHTFYDDLFILQLNDMQWFECATVGGKIQRRANHEAVCYDSQLMIFGGIGQNGFYSFEVIKIELDKTKSTSYLIDEQVKVKQQEIQSLKRSQTIKGNVNTTAEKRKEKIQQNEEFIKSLQFEQEGLKNLVNKLNFKNYKSFIPLPVIFKRKKSNTSTLSKEEEKIKKEALDEEVNQHIDADRKINEMISQSPININPSPKLIPVTPSPRSVITPRRKVSLIHSLTVNNLESKSLALNKSQSEITRKMSGNFRQQLSPTLDLSFNNIFILPK